MQFEPVTLHRGFAQQFLRRLLGNTGSFMKSSKETLDPRVEDSGATDEVTLLKFVNRVTNEIQMGLEKRIPPTVEVYEV